MKSLVVSAIGSFAIAATVCAAGPEALLRLYEEEILAHDLYVALAKDYPDIMPLRNIPQSELRHRQALATILKAEGIRLPKPAKRRHFVSEGLDATFAKWLAEGRESAVAACRAGVRLEDHDIADLRQAQLDFPKHKAVLAQLEAASNNHLRAFHRNLTARGGTYTPEAIPAKDFTAILNGTNAGACGAGPGQNQPARSEAAPPKGCGPCARPPAGEDSKAATPKVRRKAGKR